MKFSIKRKELKALSRLSADKDARFYLCGVCVTQDQHGTFIEATDGHKLGRLRVSSEPKPAAQVIIGSADIDKIKGTKKQAEDWLHFMVDGQQITVVTPDATMVFTAVDGRFPDTDRITPEIYLDTVELSVAQFNPEYLMAFMAASEDLTGRKQIPIVLSRGQDSAIVTLPAVDEFVGVLMPTRTDVKDAAIPAWLYQRKNPAPANVDTDAQVTHAEAE